MLKGTFNQEKAFSLIVKSLQMFVESSTHHPELRTPGLPGLAPAAAVLGPHGQDVLPQLARHRLQPQDLDLGGAVTYRVDTEIRHCML